MKIAQLIVIVGLAGGAFACGQKGPLVMPDGQKPKRTIPTLPRTPAKPATNPSPAGEPPATGSAPAAPQTPSSSPPASSPPR